MQYHSKMPHSGFGIMSTLIPIVYLVVIYGVMFFLVKYRTTLDPEILELTAKTFSVLSGLGVVGIGVAIGFAIADMKRSGSYKLYNKIGLLINSFVLLIVFVPEINGFVANAVSEMARS